MTNFLVKPQAKPAADAGTGLTSRFDSENVPVTLQNVDTNNVSSETCSNNQRQAIGPKSDYEQTFFDFALPSNAELAPVNHFTWDAQSEAFARQAADDWMRGAAKPSSARSVRECLDLSPLDNAPRGPEQMPMETILANLDKAQNDVVDSTSEHPLDLLQKLPMKYIYFHTDVRPPYFGTRSRFGTTKQNRKLSRNPTRPFHEELDYDYDSEAEWEEPEEGDEDLNSVEDSDDNSEDDSDEMEEFLDDEGADDLPKPQKRSINRDMKPISSGLCWEDTGGKIIPDSDVSSIDLCGLRIEIISGT